MMSKMSRQKNKTLSVLQDEMSKWRQAAKEKKQRKGNKEHRTKTKQNVIWLSLGITIITTGSASAAEALLQVFAVAVDILFGGLCNPIVFWTLFRTTAWNFFCRSSQIGKTFCCWCSYFWWGRWCDANEEDMLSMIWWVSFSSE